MKSHCHFYTQKEKRLLLAHVINHKPCLINIFCNIHLLFFVSAAVVASTGELKHVFLPTVRLLKFVYSVVREDAIVMIAGRMEGYMKRKMTGVK